MPASLRIRGIEFVQSVQNARNELPCIQGKTTYIRLYTEARDLPGRFWVRGQLELSFTQGEGSEARTAVRTLHCPLPVAGSQGYRLMDQRLNWHKSLNFLLPRNTFDELGFDTSRTVTVELQDLELEHRTPDDAWQPLDHELDVRTSSKDFLKACELHVQVIGYRYTDIETRIDYEPTSVEYDIVRRFVDAAFPVGRLVYHYRTVDSPRGFDKLRRTAVRGERSDERLDLVYSMLFRHLLEIRNQDYIDERSLGLDDLPEGPVSNQPDPDRDGISNLGTLYIGLVSDPTGRFNGASMRIPGSQDSSTRVVAFAEPDVEGVLTSHEIGHVLGRRHPGVPDRLVHGRLLGQNNQYESNETLNIDDFGFVSSEQHNAERIYLGLDTRGNTPIVLRNDEYFDLMTYRFPQWLSNHTYEGIHDRLTRPGSEYGDQAPQPAWAITGEYNLLERSGSFSSLLPTLATVDQANRKQGDGADRDPPAMVEIRVRWATPTDDGRDDVEVFYPIELKTESRTDTNPNIGVFQLVIARDGDDLSAAHEPASFTLTISGSDVDIYQRMDDDKENRDAFNAGGNLASLAPSPASGSIDAGGSEAEDHDPASCIKIDYSVDEDAFYFHYDWSMLAPVARPDEAASSFQQPMDSGDFWLRLLDLLEKFIDDNKELPPISTTVQFKRNLPPELRSGPDAETWETVGFSNRLKERLWLSPAFTAMLDSAGRDRISLPDENQFVRRQTIGEFRTTLDELGLRFRVIVTIMGRNLLAYGTERPERSFVDNIKTTIDIESLGSMGPDRLNYFRNFDSRYDDCSDLDRADQAPGDEFNCRQYYRPTVRLVPE